VTRPGDDERLLKEARRLAAQRRAAAHETRKADELARSVLADAAGRPVMDHLRELADTCDLSTPADGTLLWSHVHQPRRGAPVSNQDLAAAYAKDPRRRSPASLPIHLTPGGEWFAKVLDNPNVRRKLISPRERAELWGRLSRRFAGQARGRVLVFAATAHPKSYLYRHELPMLRDNPAVGPGRIVFVHAVDGSAGRARGAGGGSSFAPVRVLSGRQTREARVATPTPVATAKRSAAGGFSLFKTLMVVGVLIVVARNPQESEEVVAVVVGWIVEVVDPHAPALADFFEGFATLLIDLIEDLASG
jgi:hypothetical protein